MTLNVARCELLVTLPDGFRGGWGPKAIDKRKRECEKEVEAGPGCGVALL